jgi:peptide/nickel transport system substrate-binding protein
VTRVPDDVRDAANGGARDTGGDSVDAELRTFLIADVRGYTSFTQRHGDEVAAKLAGKFARVTREVVEDHIGQVLELRGDEALCVFVSPRQAVRCAVALQRRYVEETGWEATLPLPVGIGMDVGEAVPVEGGYRSGALNLAARLCSIARPGEILATPELTHLTRRLDGMSFVGRDPIRLKGLSEPVRPVRVAPDGEDPRTQLAALGALPPKPAALVGPDWLPDGLRRRPALLAVAPVVVAVAAASVLVVRVAGGASLPGFHENVLGTVDLASGRLTSQSVVGQGPGALAVAGGAAWVVNRDDDTVSRLDLADGHVTDTVDVGQAPSGIAVAGPDVWVANSGSGNLTRIDAATGHVTKTLPVGNGPSALTYGDGAVWVVDTVGEAVYRVDPATGTARLVAHVPGSPNSIAVAGGQLWVSAGLTGNVDVLDPESGKTLASVPVGSDPRAVTAIGDSVWVANNLSGTVSRISLKDRAVTGARVGAGPVAIAGDDRSVWVASADARSLTHIDPADNDNRVVGTVATGSAPQAVAVAGGKLLVAAAANPSLHQGGTLTVAVAEPLDAIDPAYGYYAAAWELLSATNDGLLAFRRVPGAEGDTVVPDLATALPTVSPDGRTYTFTLRAGIHWSTGAAVTGEDIRRGLERTVAAQQWPLYGGPKVRTGIVGAHECTSSRCDLSKGIQYDAATRLLTIRLTKPDSEFLDKVAQIGADAVPANTPLGKLPAGEAIPSTGPYVITKLTDTHIELDRNPKFQEWSAAAQPDGYPDRIIADTYTGTGSEPRWTDRDWVVGAGGNDLTALRDKFGSRVRTQPEFGTNYLFLNASRPPFDNPQARRAVAYALDRSAIAADWSTPATVTCQILPPGIPGYQPYCPFTLPSRVPGQWRAADLTKARALVEASHTSGDRVRLIVPTEIHAFDQIADTLSFLNYDVTVIRAPISARGPDGYFSRLISSVHHVEAGFEGWGSDYPAASNFLQTQLACSNRDVADTGANYGQFCDPVLDTMMQRAARIQLTDPAAAAAQWTAIEHRAVNEAGLIGLVTPADIDILGTHIGHAERHPLLGAMLDQAWVQ